MGSERCFNAKKFFFWVGTMGKYRENKLPLVSGVPTPKFRDIPNVGGGPNLFGTHCS